MIKQSLRSCSARASNLFTASFSSFNGLQQDIIEWLKDENWEQIPNQSYIDGINLRTALSITNLNKIVIDNYNNYLIYV